MRKGQSLLWAVALTAASVAWAGEGQPAEEKKPDRSPARGTPPPIPLHTIEGVSGVFITPTAYFANLPEDDGWWGKPSVAESFVDLSHDRNLSATTITTNFFRRFELGYSFIRLHLGDWPDDIQTITGAHTKSNVRLNTLNARAMLIREGEWDTSWVPAVTAGVAYKHNNSIWQINDDLHGACKSVLGVKDDDGWEATLTASKMFVGILPRPFILSAGLRNTDAAQIGLLGFSGDRRTLFEGSAVFFVTDRLLLAGEYRQKPDDLGRVPTGVGKEDDWWTLAAAYIVNDHLTAALGYGHFGNILNHDENAGWAVQLKWEF